MSSRMKHLFLVSLFSVLMTKDSEHARYAFNVEWFDPEAGVARPFLMTFYAKDETVELFDTKFHRLFLRRTKCNTVTADDLHIGASLNIFSRQIKILSFADEYTKTRLGVLKQRTFAMLKPEVVGKMGKIFKIITENGLKITKMRMAQMTKEQAEEFYEEHAGKLFLPSLIDYITSGPVVGMELVAENAVKRWRELLGPTDSEVARRDAPTSIRARFGVDKTHNAAHGSDATESAERELNFFFSPARLSRGLAPETTATFKNCTLCVIKPHAILEGYASDIIETIQENGFKVTALQMFDVEHASAEEFYEVYKGVVAEYPGMVSQLSSGTSIAMEIVGDDENTPSRFRALVGPSDPDIAKQLRPNTLRARFGKTKLENAIHCTDLPEDGILEVEYFFRLLQ